MWHELFHYHELQRLACLLSEGVFRSLCCLAGEMWRSRRLCVDPSSGMESLSVKKKSFSVDGPGPAGSSTTPTHTLRPVCPFTVDCHVKHIDSLWNQNHGLTVNKMHTYVAIMPCGKKTLFWPTQDLRVPRGRRLVVVCKCVCSRDSMTTPDLLFPVEH